MEQRQDHSQKTETPQSCFSSPVLQQFFYCHEYEKISHICTKKSEDTILYKAPFCLIFFFTKTILDM